jgi:DNA polymerase-3 subunit delta'
MILYSKDNITSAVKAMKTSGRLAHGFLLTGEKGTGRKTMAAYIAKTVLCDSPKDGEPCGVCRQCRRVDEGNHPDVIYPERSGKAMIYKAETVREMYADAYTMPNDCDGKVYILADCENIEERTQNIMLKLIEEPPDYAYFIFTSPSRSVFLPTILSRVVTMGVVPCKDSECREALAAAGKYDDESIDDAVNAFHGSIGKCMEYLEGGKAAELVKICRRVIESAVRGNEYSIYKAFYDAGEDRESFAELLRMTDNVIRDACIIRLKGADNAELTGCDRRGALMLAERLSFRKAEYIHEFLGKYADYCNSNVNVAAAAAAVSGLFM